jgi:phage gp36-like protein
VALPVYATIQDLKDLAVNASALNGMDADRLEKMLGAASRAMDEYLGAQYRLPLTHWELDVTALCCALAAEIAMSSRGYDPENPADKAIRGAADRARKQLEQIRDGVLTPSNVLDSTPNQQGIPSMPTPITAETRGFSGRGLLNANQSLPFVSKP